MNTKRLVILITFTSVFAMAARVVVESDLFWHLATGKYILENHTIPLSDPFSFTKSNMPWKGASVAWISQIALYSLYSRFGYGSLHIFTAILVVLEFIVLFKSMSGGIFLRAFTVILAASTAAVYWSPRPYMVSFVFTAFFLFILEEFQWKGKNKLYLLPITMIFWVNSHGGFIYGLILWGIYFLSNSILFVKSELVGKENKLWGSTTFQTKVKPLLFIGVLLFAATTINPQGIKMLSYPYETISQNAANNLIDEWQSPNFHNPSMIPYLILLLLTIGAIGVNGRKLSLSDFLLISFAISISLISRRNVAIFALILPIIFTRAAEPIAITMGFGINYHGLKNDKPSIQYQILNWFLYSLILITALYKAVYISSNDFNEQVISNIMPNSAVSAIQDQNLRGNIFNSYNWGGYLILNLPEHAVFIDGRADLYGDDHIDTWISIVQADEGWQEKLEENKIEIVLIEHYHPLVKELENYGWEKLFQDEKSVLFAH